MDWCRGNHSGTLLKSYDVKQLNEKMLQLFTSQANERMSDDSFSLFLSALFSAVKLKASSATHWPTPAILSTDECQKTFELLHRSVIPEVFAIYMNEPLLLILHPTRQRNWHHQPINDEGILQCLGFLVDLTVVMLKSLHGTSSPDQVADLISTIQCLVASMDRKSLFHVRNELTPLPAFVTRALLYHRYTKPSVCTKRMHWLQGGPPHGSNMTSFKRYLNKDRWITVLLEYFGQSSYGNGYTELVRILTHPQAHDLRALEVILHFVASWICMVDTEVRRTLLGPCLAVLKFVDGIVDDSAYDVSLEFLVLQHLHDIFGCILSSSMARCLLHEVEKKVRNSTLRNSNLRLCQLQSEQVDDLDIIRESRKEEFRNESDIAVSKPNMYKSHPRTPYTLSVESAEQDLIHCSSMGLVKAQQEKFEKLLSNMETRIAAIPEINAGFAHKVDEAASASAAIVQQQRARGIGGIKDHRTPCNHLVSRDTTVIEQDHCSNLVQQEKFEKLLSTLETRISAIHEINVDLARKVEAAFMVQPTQGTGGSDHGDPKDHRRKRKTR